MKGLSSSEVYLSSAPGERQSNHCTLRMRCEKNLSSFEGKDAKSEGIIPSPVSLVAEEKVSFGLYALSVSSLTVARIRKVYNKLDSKAIAKQVSQVFSQ